jgi:integrase
LNSLNGLHPTTQYTNFLLIRKFCVYLRRTDPEAYVPGEWNGPHGKQFIPHIYSQSELIRLLKGAAELKASPHCPLRPQMIRLLIVLLYTAGLRLGEALKLTLCDINWNDRYIHIRETKFYKSRLVPLSCSAMKELDSYVQLSQRSGIPSSRDSPVFQNRHTRSPYSAMCMRHIFRHLCRHLGIKTLAGRVPRLHDLRHTFAVNRVEEWYRKGDDVQSKLGLLSTYMGHTGLEGTQRYLTMTSDLLQKASERFEGFFEINRKGMLK